jgi:hypothetical protein
MVRRGYFRAAYQDDTAMNPTDILSRMDDSKITKQHWK